VRVTDDLSFMNPQLPGPSRGAAAAPRPPQPLKR